MGFTAFSLLGVGLVAYTKLIKGYNILWFLAPFAPLASYALYNWARQPQQEIENAYRYLLAKRAATCEMERNNKRFSTSKHANSKELETLRNYLRSNNMTIYELEANLVS